MIGPVSTASTSMINGGCASPGPKKPRSQLRFATITEFCSSEEGPPMSNNGMRPIHPWETLREEYLGVYGVSANALGNLGCSKRGCIQPQQQVHPPPQRIRG